MGWEIGRVPCPWFEAVAMDDDERPDPDCPDCYGTGESIGWDEHGEPVWYPCGCLSETGRGR